MPVEVEGRRLTLSNLSKFLYPPTPESAGFSKAEVVDYYTRIAPVLLPHVAGRARDVHPLAGRGRRQGVLREERARAHP